jgi:hypothetical protein
MNSHKKLDRLVSNPSAKRPKSAHEKFAERSHIMRWFGERSDKELKAMRKGFELMLNNKTATGGRL